MTASNLFVAKRAAYLIADRGSYADDGTIVQVRSKPILSNRLKLAVTTGGVNCIWIEDGIQHFPIGERLTALFETAADQREALVNLPITVSQAHQESVNAGNEGTYIQVWAALWSDEHQRPEGRVIGSPGHNFRGVAPFEVVGASGSAMPEVNRKFWPEGEVTPQSARRLILEQRMTPDDDGIYRVGVAADLVTVDRHGVRSECIYHWPQDRIGRKIDPRPWWKRWLR